MSKREAPIKTLADYLPEHSFEMIFDYIQKYHVHLTVTRDRKSVLGDYRHAHGSKNHRITVNGGLNKYAFLITLIHELAHLVTFIDYGNNVQPHGKEWKKIYARMVHPFLGRKVFPPDLDNVLEHSLHDLPASSCSDERITRALNKYDVKKEGFVMVEELAEGDLFAMEDNRVFKRGAQLRKRIQCLEISTGKIYLFSPVYEVKKLLS
jgi:SprT protein